VDLGSIRVEGLKAGESLQLQTSLKVPAHLSPGSYFLGAIADLEETVAEVSEENNTRVAPDPVSLR
jgi:hypothetical protein